MMRASPLSALPGLFCLWVGMASAAPPKIWIESKISPAAVYVNSQADLSVRFAYAVDVRSPTIGLPQARLAEIIPLGPETVGEVLRDGIRYRVHERRFALMPFASGDLEVLVSASGSTSALVAGLSGPSFRLNAAPARLRVMAAVAGGEWLPVHNLQISWADAAQPEALESPGTAPRVGDFLTRRVRVEAEGVVGSVIPALRWPSNGDFVVQGDATRTGTDVLAGRVVGWREESFRIQPRRAGQVFLPPLEMRWWNTSSQRWDHSVMNAGSLRVLPSEGRTTSAPLDPDGAPSWLKPFVLYMLLFLLAVFFVSQLPPVRRWREVKFRRWMLRRALRENSRTGHAVAAERALLGLFGRSSLEDCRRAAQERGRNQLAEEIDRLEQARYGRSSGRDEWRSDLLSQWWLRL